MQESTEMGVKKAVSRIPRANLRSGIAVLFLFLHYMVASVHLSDGGSHSMAWVRTWLVASVKGRGVGWV